MGLKNSKKKGNLLSHISHNNLDGLRKQLKRKKTDVNSITDPETPLARAVRSSNTAAVSILLDHGADPNCVFHRNYRGTEIFLWTALHEACRGSRKRVVCGQWRALRSQDPQEKEATENYDPTILKLLLEKKVNVNQGVHFGLTPLHIAAWHGNVTAVELLLKAGCDINKLDDFHESALSIAVCHGDAPMVDLLLNAGCKLNSRSWGSTWQIRGKREMQDRSYMIGQPGSHSLLSLALKYAWLNVAALLLIHGFNPNKYQMCDILRILKSSYGCVSSNHKPFLQTFIQSGYTKRPNEEMALQQLSREFADALDEAVFHWLCEAICSMKSLVQLAGACIRTHLRSVCAGVSVYSKISELPLPPSLQKMVSLATYRDTILDSTRDHATEQMEGDQLYFDLDRFQRKRNRYNRNIYIEFWLNSCCCGK